jgi:hypothetical protein
LQAAKLSQKRGKVMNKWRALGDQEDGFAAWMTTTFTVMQPTALSFTEPKQFLQVSRKQTARKNREGENACVHYTCIFEQIIYFYFAICGFFDWMLHTTRASWTCIKCINTSLHQVAFILWWTTKIRHYRIIRGNHRAKLRTSRFGKC